MSAVSGFLVCPGNCLLTGKGAVSSPAGYLGVLCIRPAYSHRLVSPETVQGKLLDRQPREHGRLFLLISAFGSRLFDVLHQKNKHINKQKSVLICFRLLKVTYEGSMALSFLPARCLPCVYYALSL